MEAAVTAGCGTSEAGGESVAEEKEAQPCRKGCRLAFVAADGRSHASRGSRTAFLRTGTGEAADVGGAFRRRIADGAAGVVGAGRRRWLRLRSLMCSVQSGIFRMKRGYDDYLYRHKQPLSFGISVRK